MRQQFLECQTPLRRMPAGRQRGQIGLGRRSVQQCQRRGELVAQRLGQQLGRQQLGGRAVDPRLGDQAPQHGLAQAFGSRVDGGQRRLGHRPVRRFGGDKLVLGVHHLQSMHTRTGLAEYTQRLPPHQLVALRAAEMKEPQGDRAGAVGEAHEQRAPAPLHDLGVFDAALDQDLLVRAQGAQCDQVRAVLVA